MSKELLLVKLWETVFYLEYSNFSQTYIPSFLKKNADYKHTRMYTEGSRHKIKDFKEIRNEGNDKENVLWNHTYQQPVQRPAKLEILST